MTKKSGASLNWGGFDRVIEGASRKLADRKTLLSNVGETLVSGTIQRFLDEESPDGKKWEPSARAWEDGLARQGRKATAKRKAVRSRAETGAFGKTLADTGDLMKSIEYAVAPDSVMVGSNKEYARVHQMGGSAGRGLKTVIPARPYLGVSDGDREVVEGLLSDFLADAFKR